MILNMRHTEYFFPIIIILFSKISLIWGFGVDCPPPFPDMNKFFKRTLELGNSRYRIRFEKMRRNLTQLGSSDDKSCACSRDLFDLDSINNRSFRCNAHSPDIADDCWDTTVAPTTVAPTTVARTTVAATTTQERRTSGGVVGTSDRPLTTRGRGTTSPERDKTSHGEKSTKFTHEASTKEADYTSRDPGPISHPELDRSTLDSVGQYETSGTTGAVVPPSPVAVVKKGQTYIYYIIAAAAVVLLAMVAGALYCSKRCRASSGAGLDHRLGPKLLRQKSDCQPLSVAPPDATSDFNNSPTSNGTLRYSRELPLVSNMATLGKDGKDKDQPLNGTKYVMLREHSTASSYDFDTFHFNTLKAMEGPYAAKIGGFGETSTDNTLPKPKVDSNGNQVAVKATGNGSDSGVEVSPTLTGRCTYDNPSFLPDDTVSVTHSIPLDQQSVSTVTSRYSAATADSKDEDALREWHAWVVNEVPTSDPKQPAEDEVLDQDNAHLFYCPPSRSDDGSDVHHGVNPNDLLDELDGPAFQITQEVAEVHSSESGDDDAFITSDDLPTEAEKSLPQSECLTLPSETIHVPPAGGTTPAYTPVTGSATSLEVTALAPPPEFSDRSPSPKPSAIVRPQITPTPSPASTTPRTEKQSVKPSPLPKTSSQSSPAQVKTIPDFSPEDGDSPAVAVIQPRLSVTELRAQFEKSRPKVDPDDHQSTLKKYGKRPVGIDNSIPSVATLPRKPKANKPSPTQNGSAVHYKPSITAAANGSAVGLPPRQAIGFTKPVDKPSAQVAPLPNPSRRGAEYGDVQL